ncbi:unnamed protein product (macronuclear) [Paramecium tetraurelia]|uniref:PHD-type domain-containing protein n=1 Tax=Paramecium tetraurelia TaxID=5888 RepID=A0BYK9_PARTE|nr:uncharacterized protein GSPATT00033479001 [Paramecium tetraurelia]CAK63626.1 unnamed protein product [Paramecium tetraurelia]|eukprot:XP_001431024.1 hypothetical protein (macronuclear) [Paramecium tetraurelia strain d4-2]
MAYENCVVCGKRQDGLYKLVPHFRSSHPSKYIHKMCLLLFRSDWNHRVAANEELYYNDYRRHCSICDKRSKQQVVRCAHSSCRNRFHLDCLNNPVIQVNSNSRNHYPKLDVYCPEHSFDLIRPNNLDKCVESIFNDHLLSQEQEPGQIQKSKHKKKHKKKHSRSRSRSHKKSRRRSSSQCRFSDSRSSKSSKSQPKNPPLPEKVGLLIIPESKITDCMIREVKNLTQAPILEKEESYIEPLPIPQPPPQPIIGQKEVEKQIIYPQTQRPFVEDPEFPYTERENKRDQSILKWWDKIEEIYFKGEEKLPYTKIEEFKNPFEWSNQGLDEELLNYADQTNIEPIIQLRFQCRGSINVLIRSSKAQYYFIRYSFTEHVGKATPKGLLRTNIQLYRYLQETVDIPTYSDKEIVGKDLIYLEGCELSKQEYQDCFELEQQIKEVNSKLESQLDIESDAIQQFDIVYHILNKELTSLVQLNNQSREQINIQINDQNFKILNTQQQLLMDLLKWSQIVKAFINGYKDKNEDVLNSFYPCQLTLTSQSSQKAQQKKKKIHSKENTQPLDTDCKICFDYHYTDINPVIYCGKCSTSFHKNCYGLTGPLDEDDVICEACSYESSKLYQFRRGAAKCGICKKLGLPQKYMRNHFYHVSCLLLTNQVILSDGAYAVRYRKNDIKQSCKDNEQSTPQCAVCGDSKGFRFLCSGGETIPCKHAFHPICAYLHGLTIDIESEDLEQCCKELRFAQLNVHIKCVLHCNKTLQELVQQTYYRRFALNYEQTAKCGGEDVFKEEFKKSKGYRYLSLKLPISRNDNLQQFINQNGTPTQQM